MKQKKQKIIHTKKTENGNPKSLKLFFLKLAFFLGILASLLHYSDKKGYFMHDRLNNRLYFRWNCFYALSKNYDVDVLLIGNSHLTNGVEPVNLSLLLGVNSFILGAPGTNTSEVYWMLKEALKRCKPKIVVLETYVINNFQSKNLSENSLSNQLKSFSARKNIALKVISTPDLFNINEYPAAWSTTIRNHNFILNKQSELDINNYLIKNKINVSYRMYMNRLYLGQNYRPSIGMSDSVLTLFKEKGANVDGKKIVYSKDSELYLDKIAALCKENNIELVFLTVPMYMQNFTNYDCLKKKLTCILSKYPSKWLNLQENEIYTKTGFNRFTFENNYHSNQHSNFNGSILVSTQLARFIKDSVQIKLPNRKTDLTWHNFFYGQESYFSHFSPRKQDPNARIIVKNKIVRNAIIKEALYVLRNNTGDNILLVKIDKKNMQDSLVSKMNLVAEIITRDKSQYKKAIVVLKQDKTFSLEDHYIFFLHIKDADIIDITDAILLKENTK